ncbi:VC0807 family protein [Pseudonocardia sp. TMWB2A]|uniref:VC0807 family protein n=3 Tax=unclassified Pseudonocardia TaxID=2619320 RepID=UPI00307F903A
MVEAAGRNGMGQALSWAQMIVLSIAVPVVVYDVLTDRGVGPVPALLAGSIGPLLDIGITWLRSRRIDEFGVLVLVFLVVGAVVGLVFSDPRILLLKESATTGVLGLLLLGSLVLLPRPLMFWFGRRFATGGDPARVAWWDGLWQYAGFRRTQRVLTAVWGVVLVAEAVVRIVLTYRLPVATMVVVNAVVPLAVLGVLIGWTVLYARRAQAAGQRRAAAAASG